MSQSVGPILAIGGITLVNNSVFHDQPVDWRIPIATGIAAVGFSMLERVSPKGVEIIAWTALLSVLFTRMNPKVPSPTESLFAWWDHNSKGK